MLDIDGRGETASEGVMLQHSKAHATVAQRTATFACLASLAAAQCPTAPGTGDVYVGGLFDHRITDRYQFEFAASLINDKTDGFYDELLPDITMQTRILDSGCNVVTATTQMMALAQDWGQPLHGVIGARCSSASMGVAMLTRLQQIPQISARSSNPSLSDKTMYSHFYRTCAPDDRQAASLAAVNALYCPREKVGFRRFPFSCKSCAAAGFHAFSLCRTSTTATSSTSSTVQVSLRYYYVPKYKTQALELIALHSQSQITTLHHQSLDDR